MLLSGSSRLVGVNGERDLSDIPEVPSGVWWEKGMKHSWLRVSYGAGLHRID